MITRRLFVPPPEPTLDEGETVALRLPAAVPFGGPLDVAVGEVWLTDRALRFEGVREGPMSAVVQGTGRPVSHRLARAAITACDVVGALLVVRAGDATLRLRLGEADRAALVRAIGRGERR